MHSLISSPYSPDLSLIEHRRFTIKNAPRKTLQIFIRLASALRTAIRLECR